jgi:hypothetical protein
VCVCVFITAVPMKKLFAWGDWCECVCLLIIFFCSESLLLDRCCCSTGVAAQQVFAPEHSGVSILCKG